MQMCVGFGVCVINQSTVSRKRFVHTLPGPIIPFEPQNDLHTKYTKMERKMIQNGTGSRVFHFGIHI